MVRITRVYTRGGDRGETRLAGGQKVRKDSSRIVAYGTVDELMSVLGVVRAVAEERAVGERAVGESGASGPVADRVETLLARVQNELFNLGATLATPKRRMRPDTPKLAPRHIQQLESDIDALNEELPALQSFILPGGGVVASHLHQARTICRRAEREVVRLGRSVSLPAEAVPYLNRLSDLLFVLARWVARVSDQPEPLWKPEEA